MKYIIAGICLLFIVSCVKVALPFEDNRQVNDPGISLYENYQVSLSTYKTDSFITSGHSVFTIGHHTDSAFGTINASSYAEIQLPASNPAKNKTVTFDSLIITLKPLPDYYGDTLVPLKISVHRLLEPIENDNNANTNFFNPRQFSFDAIPLGQLTTVVRPRRATEIKVRISDALGQDLLRKFRNDNDTIRQQETFTRYLKGIHIKADTAFSRALYYCQPDSGIIMRLYYKLQGTFAQDKHIDFSFTTQKQFNSLRVGHSGTHLALFSPFKKQLKASSVLGDRAYLNSNIGTHVRIDFPSVLNLKETSPYIKVLKAELVIKPPSSHHRYPYSLPGQLYLYTTDDGNSLKNLIVDESGQNPQTGTLMIDDLFGESTRYTYDITAFINTLIGEGRFSRLALMLVSPQGPSATKLDRLILNDSPTNKSIQLKLYVLGL